MIQYQKVLKAFKTFLEQYDTINSGVAIKISHSYHVADLANKLAKRMGLEKEQNELVQTMGLLHDLGRFIQYDKAKMYDDLKSQINHAEEADLYLFQDNHIIDFGIPSKYHPLIRVALINHNKLQIDDRLTEEEKFYCHFLRDIDKIDIFRQNATSFEWFFDGSISEEVKQAIHDKRLVDNKTVTTKTDAFLSELAYLFDIYFEESYVLLDETDNFELFLSVVEVQNGNLKEFEKIKGEVREYLVEKLPYDKK